MSNADDSSDDENEAGFEELQSEWLSKKDMEESLARAREHHQLLQATSPLQEMVLPTMLPTQST
jgi:hypothetical protein